MSASFAELAVELKIIANREAFGSSALEVLAARSGERVFEAALHEARLSARLCGQAHELLKALIPHEEAVRALLVDEDETAGAEPPHPAASQPPSPHGRRDAAAA